MNIVDKFITVFSPEAGLRRADARKKLEVRTKKEFRNSGYGNHGANSFKKSVQGWEDQGGSAKEDIHDHLPTLRQRSRDLYMGVPIATGAVKTCRTNVVGAGLRLKSQVDSEILGLSEEKARTLETQIEREFSLWADSPACDLERLDNFYELQQLAFLNWLLSGDVLVTLPALRRPETPYDLRINLIEADRLSNPDGMPSDSISGGVEVNEAGEVVAYHISAHHPLSHDMKDRKWIRVKAWGEKSGRRNVLHLMQRERIGQRRGIPYLSPVIESLKQLGRYTDAELLAAVVSGYFTVFIHRDIPWETFDLTGGIPNDLLKTSDDEDTLELAPGTIQSLGVNERAEIVNPGRPNTAFEGFVSAMCQQIGMSLEIPYEVLMKHFGQSYSASRGAMLEAGKLYRMYRNWLANDFCQPIYEEWFAEAVAKDRITAPGFFSDPLIRQAYLKAEWNGPAQGLLDPLKEVAAAEKRIKLGLSNGQKEAMEINGTDYYKNLEQQAREAPFYRRVQEMREGGENNGEK